MEGSAVSASHLPDYCRENGLEIPLPEGTKIPVDARVFVLYQGNEPDGSTYARCPLRLRKQNASLEKVFTASIPSLNTTTEEGGPTRLGVRLRRGLRKLGYAVQAGDGRLKPVFVSVVRQPSAKTMPARSCVSLLRWRANRQHNITFGGERMSHLLKIGVPLVLLATLASPVQAEQGGKWRGRAVLVTTQTMQAKVADTTDHAVEVGVQEGVVFTEEGGDFLANAHYQVVYLNDSAGMVNGGYKTFTVADDSKVFAQFTIREANPTSILGDWKFLSGTGKYQGVTGNGTFEVGIVADRVMWDVLQGEYKLP